MFQLTLKNDSTVAYRRLRAGDDLQLQTFNRNLAQLSRDFFSPHAYDDQTVAKIIARSEKEEDRTYIVLDGEKIVAYFFLWWYQTRFPVLGIGIADEYQGLGMGSQLMAILIEDGKKSGCDAIELTTMLKNKKAFSVYEKVGFQCLGKVQTLDGSGKHVEEWHLFYPFKPGVTPPPRDHIPPA